MTTIHVSADDGVDPDDLAQWIAATYGRTVTVKVEQAPLTVWATEETEVPALDLDEVMAAYISTEGREVRQLVTKARAVWRGEDTFTQAQAQKILAGLVLVVARHLR